MRNHLIVGLALGALATAAPLEAQGTSNVGMPWVGCWESVDGLRSQGRTCLAPEGDEALKMFTIAGDGSVTESTLRLDGTKAPFTIDGCTGWEQGRASKDGDRLIVDSEVKCEDAPARKRTTAFVISAAGYWLQVNATGIAVAGNAQIRAYRPIDNYEGIPAEVRRAVSPFAGDGELARNEVRDNTVSSKDLLELEAMGVSTSVIDLVVAAAYPKSFVIDAQGLTAPAQVATGDQVLGPRDHGFYVANGYPMFSQFDRDMMFQCQSIRMNGCNLAWMYGAGWGGMGMFGNPFFPFGFGGVPVIVRPVSPNPNPPGGGGSSGGRAVRGRGYTANGGGDRTVTPRANTNAGVSNGGSSANSGGSSAGSSGGSGGGGGDGGGRTAKPRTP